MPDTSDSKETPPRAPRGSQGYEEVGRVEPASESTDTVVVGVCLEPRLWPDDLRVLWTRERGPDLEPLAFGYSPDEADALAELLHTAAARAREAMGTKTKAS